jgi:hypothetical protein
LAFSSSAIVGACAPHAGKADDRTISATGGTSSGNQTGGGGTSGKWTNGGNAAGTDPGNGGVLIGPIPTQMPPSNSPDASCAKTSVTAPQNVITKTVTTIDPVALFLVQDRSGSMMDEPAAGSTMKWDQAVAAVNGFVTDPNTKDIDVALGFFPIDNGTCDGSTYSTPKVPLARLPSQMQAGAVATALTQMVPARGGGPFGQPGATGTPIEGALRGGENYCLTYQAQNPAEKCVVVLITDGEPSGCARDAATLAGIAADAKTRASVLTFAIGMEGADFNLLDQIATAGGSNCGARPSCDVTAGAASFSAALEKIRTTVSTTTTMVQNSKLACEYVIPPPTDGQKLDPDKVNVQITKDGIVDKVGRVDSAAGCAAVGNKGWYYDPPTDPKSVKLCPATCTSIEGGDAGLPAGTTAPKVDVLFGCKTEIAIPA